MSGHELAEWWDDFWLSWPGLATMAVLFVAFILWMRSKIDK